MSDHPGAFVAFDLETTGLRPGLDRIVEVGAVRCDASGAIRATFERLINPEQPSGAVARSIHGIGDELLAAAEPARAVLPAFIAFLADSRPATFLAHHSASDAGFLGSELIRAGLPLPDFHVVDTLAWSRRRWPHFGSHRLDALAARFGIDAGVAHRALADSVRVRKLFLALRTDDPDPDHPPLAYPLHDGAGPPPIPRGWDAVAELIDREGKLSIEYAGGSRGPQPRAICPRRFTSRGGVAYLVALCLEDRKVRGLPLARSRRFRVIGPDRPDGSS